MDDYGYQLHHAVQPYALSHNSNLALVPSAYSPSYNSNVSLGLFSEGILPAYDQFKTDPFFAQSDQQCLHNLMVCQGSGQFDPLYASLDLPNYGTPSLDDFQVYGSPSYGSCKSTIKGSFESSLLWSDVLVTNALDTGVTLLSDQMYLPLQMVGDNETKECLNFSTEQGAVKYTVGPRQLPKRNRKRSAKQMKECDKYEIYNNSVADSLTWEILSQYFYKPIAQAARELNIGLTLFKKRCRELGVRRWPHRKLMSIQSLIKNVKNQEMEKEGGVDPVLSKLTVRNAIQELENQRKLMEVMPDVELEAQTKRLRQACFKANYKKRRLMIMNGDDMDNSTSKSSSNHANESSIIDTVANNISYSNGLDFQDSDELKSLLFDSLSPSDCSLLNNYYI